MKHIAAIIALLFVSAMATEALAQPRDEPGRPHADREAPRRKPAVAKQRLNKIRARLLRRRVGLSDAKAKKVEEIFKRHNREQKKIRKLVREGKMELRDLLRADSDDQKAYESALKKLHDAQRAQQKMRDMQYAELKQALKPKEQAKLLRALHKVRKHLRRARAGRRPPQGQRGPRWRGNKRRGEGRRPPFRRPPPRR